MSSFARRTLRTTIAVAGMAALGAGLAGNAFAAPAPPQSVPTTEVAPGVSTESPLATVGSLAGAADTVLPAALLAVQAPLKTDTRTSTAAPNRATSTSDTTTVRGDSQSYTAQTSSTQNPDGALAQMDSGRLVGDAVKTVGLPQAVSGSTLGLPLG